MSAAGLLLRAAASSRREKRPLVTYSDNAEAGWKAKIEGDYWPEPPRPSRLPMMAAGMAAALFLAAFFGARQAAVAALPDLAGLYAAVGLPVNLDGLAIEAIGAERTPTFAGFKLKVHATVRNIGKSEEAIPPLAAYSSTAIRSHRRARMALILPIAPSDRVKSARSQWNSTARQKRRRR